MSINIGLTGWGDHDSLYHSNISPQEKLAVYASFFPVVEVDTAFYAIQPVKNYEKWVKYTPDNFSFVIKAYQTMTGHDRKSITKGDFKQIMDQYRESIQPVINAGKLNSILFQFPPWFNLKRDHVNRLRFIRDYFSDLPLALEFRNQTWFAPQFRERTLQFMKEENWIHTICDEPQAGEGSVPTVLEPTHPEQTLIRFHGRNVHGWNRNGRSDWRKVRFLYRYSIEELSEWAGWIHDLQRKTKNITILFNNNSGKDAAANAKQLMELLHIQYEGLNPRQMDLFDGGLA